MLVIPDFLFYLNALAIVLVHHEDYVAGYVLCHLTNQISELKSSSKYRSMVYDDKTNSEALYRCDIRYLTIYCS